MKDFSDIPASNMFPWLVAFASNVSRAAVESESLLSRLALDRDLMNDSIR